MLTSLRLRSVMVWTKLLNGTRLLLLCSIIVTCWAICFLLGYRWRNRGEYYFGSAWYKSRIPCFYSLNTNGLIFSTPQPKWNVLLCVEGKEELLGHLVGKLSAGLIAWVSKLLVDSISEQLFTMVPHNGEEGLVKGSRNSTIFVHFAQPRLRLMKENNAMWSAHFMNNL